MHLSTAPPLILGLGARLISCKLLHPHTIQSATYNVLFGLWQGVLLYYVWMEQPDIASGIALGLGVRLVLDYVSIRDAMRLSTTVLSVAVGVLVADLLAQVFEDGVLDDDLGPEGAAGTQISRRERLVQFKSHTHNRHRSGYEAQSEASRENRFHQGRTLLESEESDFLGSLVNSQSRSPMDQEVAALRSRASMADANRRRCREEKKWALSQGNNARASQLSWQLKRYTALAESFHREADARVIEASKNYHSRPASTHVGSMWGYPATKEGSQQTSVKVHVTNGQVSQKWSPRSTSSAIRIRHDGSMFTEGLTNYPEESSSVAPVSDEWSRALD